MMSYRSSRVSRSSSPSMPRRRTRVAAGSSSSSRRHRRRRDCSDNNSGSIMSGEQSPVPLPAFAHYPHISTGPLRPPLWFACAPPQVFGGAVRPRGIERAEIEADPIGSCAERQVQQIESRSLLTGVPFVHRHSAFPDSAMSGALSSNSPHLATHQNATDLLARKAVLIAGSYADCA